MLRRSRGYVNHEGAENAVFAKMGADDLRFDSNMFDSVACCWALHLFSDVPAALTEMHRVLKDGGRLAATTLTDEHILALPGMQDGLRQTVGADYSTVVISGPSCRRRTLQPSSLRNTAQPSSIERRGRDAMYRTSCHLCPEQQGCTLSVGYGAG